MSSGAPLRPHKPAASGPFGSSRFGFALLAGLCAAACCQGALGQGRPDAPADPATPEIDPLPPLGPRLSPGGYPAPPAVQPAAYPAGNYPPGAYPPDGAINPAAPAAPVYGPPPPTLGAPYATAPPMDQPSPAPVDVPPAGDSFQTGGPLVPGGPNSAAHLLDHLEGNVVVRGFYRNDQRIVWSGMEETFGTEADLTPRLRFRDGDFEFIVDSEFWITQPYGKNPLENTPERQSYAADFDINPFAIGQLALVTNYENWTFKIGKFVTPFGRTYYTTYTNPYLTTNNAMDQPFIRTEVIDNRETGILAHYKNGLFVGDVALTNSGDDMDTNSSKALVARVGLEGESWALGASAKKENGSGSDEDKEFGNYYGVDMMIRTGPFTFSTECVYNQYGFGRPGFDPDDIYWIKSIYYRDESSGQAGVPLTGVGYYVDVDYAAGRWGATLNYGEFYPLSTGTAPDQRIERRGLAQVAYHIADPLQSYTVLILENDGYTAQDNHARSGVAFLQGFQFTF